MQLWALLFVVGAAVAACAQQSVFQDVFPAPEQELSALSIAEYSTFSHPSFPKHSVRIKRLEDFCDTTGVK